jgi:hypothetical protein
VMLGLHLTGAAWSPDGRWIGVLQGTSETKDIILISAADPSQHRMLGRTRDNQIRWSPDSKCLLMLNQNDRHCGLLQSVEILDIETGMSKLVESSRCKIFHGAVGWLSSGVLK